MYKKLAIVVAINTIVMFLITYVTLWELGHFQPNINRLYMALVMVAPMVLTMMVVMRSMYENKRLNLALYIGFAALFVLALVGIRTQTPVGDDQFLRSMIPHHSSAILMCEEASISDPEVATLCDEIVKTQKEEIAQMEALLAER
ncbi:MAG: DUF305 domain-containing protein [Coriobacteriia bacterium]